MKQCRLLRSLKQADLAAISAYEALKFLCPELKLNSLKRYDAWIFSFRDTHSIDVDEFFSNLLSGSYFFINPSKHRAFYQNLPQSIRAQDFDLKIISCQNKSSDLIQLPTTLADQLKDVHLEQKQYWEFILETGSCNDTQFSSAIIEPNGTSASLMYNPIYQSVKLEAVESLYA